MSDNTITSANSILILGIASYVPLAQIKGFASDKAFVTDQMDLAEVQMGIDGRMTAGYIPRPVKQTITLQGDSPSKDLFVAMIQTIKSLRDVVRITGTLTLPSTGESFALTGGVLTSVKQIPDAQSVLQPLDYVITWESVDRTLI